MPDDRPSFAVLRVAIYGREKKQIGVTRFANFAIPILWAAMVRAVGVFNLPQNWPGKLRNIGPKKISDP